MGVDFTLPLTLESWLEESEDYPQIIQHLCKNREHLTPFVLTDEYTIPREEEEEEEAKENQTLPAQPSLAPTN